MKILDLIDYSTRHVSKLPGSYGIWLWFKVLFNKNFINLIDNHVQLSQCL